MIQKVIGINHFIIISTQVLFNKVFSSPEFRDKKCIDLTSITLIPKSFEVYLTETFRFFCDICMQKNGSTFTCFHYHKIRSIDSCNFLSASLANLAKELADSCKSNEEKQFEFAPLWNYVQNRWKDESIEKQLSIFDTLQNKQYFPYSFLSSLSLLENEKLPDLELWNQGFQLKDKATAEEVSTAHSVFDELGCRNIDEYLSIYLHTDVFLLTSIFQNWRRLGFHQFGLDMANFLSLPQFGLSCWLYSINDGKSENRVELLQVIIIFTRVN